MQEYRPDRQPVIDNELDIRGLFRTLWHGKLWVVGIAVLFAVIALLYSFLAKQEWGATGITDNPTVSMLGPYYTQQQFLRNQELRGDPAPAAQPSVVDQAYRAFLRQLSAYDTRRDFWLQSDYFKQRQVGDSRADAVLLDELINNIQFTPADTARNINDSIRLVAESATDSNTLLRQYVNFASMRAANHLNGELSGDWAARTTQLNAQVKRQEAVARALYERKLKSVEEALRIAEQQNINRSQTGIPTDEIPDSEMFMLGRPMLQARLESLQAMGPTSDLEYDQNIALLNTLNVGPSIDPHFQTYRYLRTPEEPVKRDSPRRAFLMIMWGTVGALIGAGIALARRQKAL